MRANEKGYGFLGFLLLLAILLLIGWVIYVNVLEPLTAQIPSTGGVPSEGLNMLLKLLGL